MYLRRLPAYIVSEPPRGQSGVTTGMGGHMTIRFVDSNAEEQADSNEARSGYDPAILQELLTRHGARTTAGPVLDTAERRPTAYRRNALLIDADTWNVQAKQDAIRTTLKDAGMVAEDAATEIEGAPIRVTVNPDESGKPVDASKALEQLDKAAQDDASELTPETAAEVHPEPLITTMAGALTLVPWAISVDPVGQFGPQPGAYGKVAVKVLAGLPPRPGPRGGRRPVIAVVDTGLVPHPDLDVFEVNGAPFEDQFITVAPDIQNAIFSSHRKAPTACTMRFKDHEERPSNLLNGTVDEAFGHGTFIAGIIRQAAPAARVLAIKAVNSDRVGYAGDALIALHGILNRVKAAQERPQDEVKRLGMVDIVSFSAGYYADTDRWPGTKQLVKVIDELTARGVLVLAAAGNDATDQRFYPAALSTRPVDEGSGPQVIGVGALNPDGTKSLFSNEAAWVNCWADGVAVISTYPPQVNGPFNPPGVAKLERWGYDPDNFASGYAMWSGTSFATPLVASALAEELMNVAEEDADLALTDLDRESTVKRAREALERARARYR